MFTIRPAVCGDEKCILTLILELAAYEKLAHEVVATEEILHEWLFEKKKAQVLIAEEDGVCVGYALYFYNFSTFLGRAGIYLEDLYIRPAFRKKGYGKALLQKLAQIAVCEGCGRLEWSCLDWNLPSIDFYRSLNAVPMDGWTTYRLTGSTLHALAETSV